MLIREIWRLTRHGIVDELGGRLLLERVAQRHLEVGAQVVERVGPATCVVAVSH